MGIKRTKKIRILLFFIFGDLFISKIKISIKQPFSTVRLDLSKFIHITNNSFLTYLMFLDKSGFFKHKKMKRFCILIYLFLAIFTITLSAREVKRESEHALFEPYIEKSSLALLIMSVLKDSEFLVLDKNLQLRILIAMYQMLEKHLKSTYGMNAESKNRRMKRSQDSM